MKDKRTVYLKIAQILAFLQILCAFIPYCNPFRVENVKAPLAAMLWKVGGVSSYFASKDVDALSLGNTLFVFALIITVSLLFVLMTWILTLTQSDYKRRAIGQGVFFGLVLTVTYFVMFVVFTDLNTQILSMSGEIHRKLEVLTHTPLGIYIHFLLALGFTVFSYLAYDFDYNALWYAIRSKFSNQFKGGIHPPYHKHTAGRPIQMMEADKLMVYPLSQHIGAPCKPLVAVGDDVLLGQKIAESDAFMSAPIHSSVSGKVVKIDMHPHPTANEVMAITVENDFMDRKDPSIESVNRDYTTLTAEEIIGYVREAGIVGMGGAAFPTHVKMSSALGKVDTVIINAAECEPYLSSDHRVLLENTAEFVEGVKVIRKALGVRRVYVGIESNKPDAITKLYRAFRKTGIRVVVLATKYPQGGEKQLIKAVTGREVPSGKLPADAGCCVFNVDTAIAIYRAVVKGYPLMRRIVTVAGGAVETETNMNVRLGTSIQSVVAKCGLQEDKLRKLIMGGPMMGMAICNLDAPVIKGTSALLCFTEDKIVEDRADHSCIRCGRCISVCPMRLTPIYINLYASRNEIGKTKSLNVMDCIECGCCSYTCPAKLPLLQNIRVAKQKVRDEMAKGKARKEG